MQKSEVMSSKKRPALVSSSPSRSSSSYSSSSHPLFSQSKKSRREPISDQPVNLQDALNDEFGSSTTESSSRKKYCSLCGSSKPLIRIEEGEELRLNEVIDVELYLNSLLLKDGKRSVHKPISLCPLCHAIAKKYIHQKGRIASLEAFKEDPRKKLSEIEAMWKALNSEVRVRVKRLDETAAKTRKKVPKEDPRKTHGRLNNETCLLKKELHDLASDLEAQKKRNASLELQVLHFKGLSASQCKSNGEEGASKNATNKSTNTENHQEGHTVETYEVLLLERDKEMAQLDRVLKSTVKVKDMAIDAQNLLKYKNTQLEKKMASLERISNLSSEERSLVNVIEKVTNDMEALKNENENLNEVNLKLGSQLSEVKETLASMSKELSASKVQGVKLSAELSEAKALIMGKEEEMAIKSKEVESLSHEISQARKDIQSQLSVDHAKDLESLKEELSQRDTALKEAKGALLEKEGELSKKSQRLIEIKLLASKHEKQVQEFERLFGDDMQEGSRKSISEQIQELKQTILKLRSELSSKSKEVDSRYIENAETLSLLNAELQELKKELNLKEKDVQTLDESFASQKAVIEKLKAEKRKLVHTIVDNFGRSRLLPNSTTSNSNNNVSSPTDLFNSGNAKIFFGEGMDQLSQSLLSKSLFFANRLFRYFGDTFPQLRTGGASLGDLKKVFDAKLESFSKSLKAEGLSHVLIYTLFSEAFLLFFGRFPCGVARRRLTLQDKLLQSSLPSMTEASEIVAKTPVLIDVLDEPTEPPQRPFIKVRTNLLASTASPLTATNTISPISSTAPSLNGSHQNHSAIVTTTSSSSDSSSSFPRLLQGQVNPGERRILHPINYGLQVLPLDNLTL